MSNAEIVLPKNKFDLIKPRVMTLEHSADAARLPESHLAHIDSLSVAQVSLGHPEDEFDLKLFKTVLEQEVVHTAVLTDGLGLSDDVSGSVEVHTTISSESFDYYQARAHELLKQRSETFDRFTDKVAEDMAATYAMGPSVVVAGISGMSGSGKTTAAQMVADKLVGLFGEAYRPLVLSSDDYHKGRLWLEETYGAPWTNWDDPRVYDTAALGFDLELLRAGEPVMRRHFDFNVEETVEDGVEQSRPFVIVEGIFSGSPDLSAVRNLHYEVPTSPATSVGRDIRRLVLDNRANGSIGSPEARLRYQLETALPTYHEQQRPRKNVFPASARPLGERAFMLERLRNTTEA